MTYKHLLAPVAAIMAFAFAFAPQISEATLKLSKSVPDSSVQRELDFVMAHKPDNAQNVALIQEFADKVHERTDGAVKINLIDAFDKFGDLNGKTLDEVRSKLYTGEVAMSQVSLKKFVTYSPIVDALDMPMVFRDHDHVKAVVDGPIGLQVRDSVYDGSDGQIYGLAFTYSGGFRNIYTTSQPVSSVSDLKGMKMRARSNRSGRDAVHHLGIVQSHDLGRNFALASSRGDILAEEAETLRLLTWANVAPELIKNIKTVLVTNHSVFLTLIAVNGPIFNSLTPEQRAIIREEVKVLADKERELSIQQAIDGRAMFEKRGIDFVDVSAEDKEILDGMGQRVLTKYKDQPVGKVMQAIIDTK